MCGIAGYQYDKSTGRALSLEKALARLSHRGPDDQDLCTEEGLGLGQTRLSIIDLEGGRQPLYSKDRQLVLVANGEVYNFIELREELEKKGHCFLTRSDSEVILHSYAEYGDAFLEYLNGMFAFALYDRRNGRLILARDRLGIKPLFISQLRDCLVFASELKALLPLLDRSPAIDPQGLVQYLQNQFSTGRTTIIEGVERILPGEAVCIESGMITKRWTYWSSLDTRPLDCTFEEAGDRFDGIMDRVMVEHMRSDVPYGLFLSGGVDSAVLLALLSRFRDEPVRTFSVGFPGTRLTDELPLAQEMAQLFSSRHVSITPSEEDIFNVLPLTVWAADELMRDYASLPTCLLSERAGSELKVVFSGEGGDEVFGGYGRYRSSYLERKVKSLLSPGSGGFRTRGTFNRAWIRKLFRDPLRAVIPAARKPFVDSWSQTPPVWSDLQRMQHLDLVTAMPDNLLVKADRMMMAWGLEGRVPFLDHRIVEFGLSLPDRLKTGPGQGKLFLKKWASKYIPEEYLSRPKKGFHVPVSEWMRGFFLEELGRLLPQDEGVGTWFYPDGIKSLVARSPGSPVLGRMVWSILQFAIWHRLFIQGDGLRPPSSQNPLDLLERSR